MDQSILFFLEMAMLGIGVGVLAAGLGLGGGILMVPAFVTFIPGIDSHTAKGTSLFVIIFVAAYNAWQLNRGRKDTPYGIATSIAVGSMLGVYAGTWLTSLISDAAVSLLFAIFVVVTGIRTLFIQPKPVRAEDVRPRYGIGVLIGMAMGLVSGATGIGGGGVMVPLALVAGIVSNSRVVALSNMVMVVTCLVGAIAHAVEPATFVRPWTVGHVYLAVAPMVIAGALAGAPLGRMLNRRLTLNRRKWIMGLLLLFIAARMAYRVVATAG